MNPVLTKSVLKEKVVPSTWYRLREFKELYPEFGEATLIRFLRRVPYVESREPVPGCKIECLRPVRLYSGQAIIDWAYADREESSK